MGSRAIGAFVLALVLLGSEVARAQVEPYDPGEALAQSLGYSLAVAGVGGLLLLTEPVFGAATLGLGLTVTPSLGHFYADNWVQGALTASGRLITATAAVVCLVGAAFPEQIDSQAEPDAWPRQRKMLLAVGLAATSATIGLASFDIATAPGAARRGNARLALARRRPRWTAWLTTGGGGVAIEAAF